MKNKTFTVSTALLDTNTVQVVETYLDITTTVFTGNSEIKRHYPVMMQMINGTGQTIKYNIFSSSEEYAEYVEDATNFDLVTLHNSEKIFWRASQNMPIPYKLVIQMPAGTSSTAFIIECINYHPRLS